MTNEEVFFAAVATVQKKYKDLLADNHILLAEIAQLRADLAAARAALATAEAYKVASWKLSSALDDILGLTTVGAERVHAIAEKALKEYDDFDSTHRNREINS